MTDWTEWHLLTKVNASESRWTWCDGRQHMLTRTAGGPVTTLDIRFVPCVCASPSSESGSTE